MTKTGGTFSSRAQLLDKPSGMSQHNNMKHHSVCDTRKDVVGLCQIFLENIVIELFFSKH